MKLLLPFLTPPVASGRRYENVSVCEVVQPQNILQINDCRQVCGDEGNNPHRVRKDITLTCFVLDS